MKEKCLRIKQLLDILSNLKNISILVLGVIILILSIIVFNKTRKINKMSDLLDEYEASISNLNSELSDSKSTIYELYSQVEKYKDSIENMRINITLNTYSKSVTTTTKGGTTTTSVKYHKKCDEEVSGLDEGEIIKKCGAYIIVKTFQGYVVAHSWSEGYVGDDVEGDIWWGIGWEDWLIDCKKVNVKIEVKGDWEEVSKWIKKNC